ncbi:hypothetical protein QEJ31_11110 [Pigmentibacter sp. JX0631]|uniref:hypothetical protein n=1 Tax=Pigmentibacter sp. JX0631 TaxID=2976982 RepID=UPI00246927D3|nr:hypothetical protein [Pigmentibacter sp. JX0631]WGL59068.1 hypothetical protein QEJ31_11110 [Pigmentibacter sp. JX0631]
MPIDAQNIVYFNNIQANHPAYISILPDYINKNIQCKLNHTGKNIHVFQKKWILQTEDKQKELELLNENVDFSVAKKYPIITCESILFDGVLYRKETKTFSDFLFWKNLSPGVYFYTFSNISEFSMSDFFGKKSSNSFYYCESLSGTEYEKKFCSLLDPETGQIEKKNSDSQILYQLLNSEKYRIFNINIGIKNEKKVEIKNNVKFVLMPSEESKNIGNIPPNIEFFETGKSISLLCNTNQFLNSPNNIKYIWYENGKKILDENKNILPSKKIIYGNNYSCENSNGLSSNVKIDSKILKIVGKKQISFQENDLSISEIYYTNTNLDENKIKWSCFESNDLKCKVLKKDNKIQITIEGLDKIRRGNKNSFVTLKLDTENELIEKKIILYFLKSDEINLQNISKEITVKYNSKVDSYDCNIPDNIRDITDFHVKWFLNEKELIDFKDSLIAKNNQFNGLLNCIVYGKNKNELFIGANAKKIVNFNEKNPSWLKESYLYNPEINNKMMLFQNKKNHNNNKLECFILNTSGDKITENICKLNKNGFNEISITQLDFHIISEYLKKNEIFDIFNLPKLPLLIRFFEDKKVTDYYSTFKIIIPNYKPVILSSGLITNNNSQNCYAIVSNPQKLFLSAEFYLVKNKIKKNISPFDKFDQNSQQEVFKNSFSNFDVFQYKFKFEKKEDSCLINISNGTQSSFSKAKLVSEDKMKKDIKALEHLNLHQKNISSNLIFGRKNKLLISELNKSVNDLESIETEFKIDKKRNNSENLFYLDYFYKDSKTYLNVYFPLKIFFDNNELVQKNIPLANHQKSKENFSNFFFSSRIYQDSKNKNRFYCEVTSNDSKYLKDLNFSIFLNSEMIQERIGDIQGVFFDIDNYEIGDNVICQIESKEMFDRSSFNQKEQSELQSFCIARDYNNSIFKFSCPAIVATKINSKEIKFALKDFLIRNFKNYSDIDAVNVNIWSLSEKNKYSISMSFKNVLEEL